MGIIKVMDPRFQQYIKSIELPFQILLQMEPVRVHSLPSRIPDKGVYLFSEGKRHLYVGRSNNLKSRLQQHCRPSSGHNSAPFAFRIARKVTGRLEASYVRAGSRSELETDKEFAEAFKKAKERVRGMDVRFIEEGDQLRQALLEIYTAVALHTPYNDFGTH